MYRSGFTLEQLRSFVAVARHQHVSRAAGSLFLSQAAVTQQLHHFERAVGVQLLERSGRGVRLTDAGRSLVEACQAALRAVEVVSETAEAMKQLETGTLQLGASPTCATYYVPAHLAEFSRRNPAVRLNLAVDTSTDLNRQVRSGALDCAVVEGSPDPGLVPFELARDELVLVVHRDHPLARRRTLTARELAGHRYLGRGQQWSAERSVREMIGDAYDHVDVLSLGHPEYVRAAAVAGLGFAALPLRAVVPELHAGILTRLPLPPYVRAITAVRRPGRGGPVQEAFWAQLTGGAAWPSPTITRDVSPGP
jgi:DNA-binding transcriptional LysR family regulator